VSGDGLGRILSGAVLAGGAGRRLGIDKAGLVVNGAPVLTELLALLDGFCPEVVVAIGERRPLPFPGVARLVEDLFPGMGPLAGIHAALSAIHREACLILACDMPFVRRELIAIMRERMRPGRAVVFEIGGYIEPFPGIYPRSLLARLEESLRRGDLGVQAFLRRVPAVVLPEAVARGVDPGLISFTNLNTPEDIPREGKCA